MIATATMTTPIEPSDAVAARTAAEPTIGDENLANDLRHVYAALFRSYADEMVKPDAESDPSARWGGPEWADRVVEAPARLLSWTDITALIEQHPERVLELWARVKQEASEELASGHRAALALNDGSGPWERAQFLAIRDAFIDEWNPRGGIEVALIDQMATAHAQYLGWLERLQAERANRSLTAAINGRQTSQYEPPRVTSAEAVEEAAAMAERFQRVFVRAIRTLRDLRRFTPSVVVQNAGQVNVAAVQTNQVAGSPEGVPPEAAEA
jgi:hypothetical protein